MKKIFMSSVFCVLFLNILSAQETSTLPEVVSPPPTAFELGKFGEVPVGMFNGTANINISVYTFKSKNLSVPISLSYSNSGLRVDQISTWVGLGWNLNAGGVITRTVKDEPDSPGYERFSPDAEMENAGFLDNPDVLEYLYNIGSGGIDSEHDIYNFNFFGYSGQFIMDGYGRPYLLSHNSPLRIQPYRSNYKAAFKIITPDGVIFDFNSQEDTAAKDPECEVVYGGDVSNNFPIPETGPRYETSWFITSITHPSGDRIDFVYEPNSYVYYPGISENYTRNQDVLNTSGACGKCPQDKLVRCKSQMFVNGLQLKEIRSNNPIDGKVILTANLTHPVIAGYEMLENIKVLDDNNGIVENFDLSYSFTANSRVFLDQVTFIDPARKYVMSYINKEAFPERLTLGQDYWGYYNGKDNNQYLIPKINNDFWLNFGGDREPSLVLTETGLLKRITYPTGGYNEFTYEPNDYYGIKRTYTRYNTLVSTTTAQGFNATENITMGSDYHESAAYSTFIQAYPTIESGPSGGNPSNPTADEAIVKVIDVTDNNNEIYSFAISSVNHLYQRIRLQKNHQYQLQISKLDATDFVSKLIHYTEAITNENIVSSGVRIKKVDALDPVRNKNTVKNYYYQSKNNSTHSSGHEGNKQDFETESMVRLGCNSGPMNSCFIQDCFFFNLSSSSNGFPTDLRGNSIYYDRVMVSLGGPNYEAGGEEHEFILNRLSTTDMITGTGQFLQISLNNQDAANNGREKRTAFYKKEGDGSLTRLYEKENMYQEDTSFHYEIPSYVAKKVYDYKCTFQNYGDGSYECQTDDLTKRYPRHYCAANHEHIWTYQQHQVCIALNNDNQLSYRNHPCYGKQEGDPVSYWAPIWNLEILRKYNVSERYFLDQTTERFYDETGLNPLEKVTRYYYDNPKHLQVTRTEITDSKGDSLSTKIFYPDDVNELSGLSSQQKYAAELLGLIYQHRVTQPIQTESYRNGELLATQRTLFKDWGNGLVLPEEIQTLKGASGTLEKRIQYRRYDTEGNPLEVSQTSGMPISYLWGYNNKYPVAKVDNATYDQVTAPATGVTLAIVATPPNDDGLRTTLNNLRTNLPEAMVTTYTYKPLVGATSMTDPTGYTTFYKYDDYNRLQNIKDDENFLQQEYFYHYKGEPVTHTGLTLGTISGPTNAFTGDTGVFAITIASGSGSYNYSWQFEKPDGSFTSPQTGTTLNTTFDGSFIGDNTLRCMVTDTNSGLQRQASLTVTVYEAQVISQIVSPNPWIITDEATNFSVSASGGSGNFTYFWTFTSPGDGPITASGATVNPVLPNSFNDQVTVSCDITDTGINNTTTRVLNVQGYTAVTQAAITAPSTANSGEQFTLTANATEGSGSYQYNWSFSPSSSVSISTTTSQTATPTISGGYTGTISVTSTVTDAVTARTAVSSKDITVYAALSTGTITAPFPVINSSNGTAEYTFTITPSGGSGSYNYAWYVDDVLQPAATGNTMSYDLSCNQTKAIKCVVTDQATSATETQLQNFTFNDPSTCN